MTLPSFSTGWLLTSMLVSSIGAVLFIYGKRESRLPHMLVGAIFSVYPYFVTDSLLLTLIAACLIVGLTLAVTLGW